jgi:hypothetical protein
MRLRLALFLAVLGSAACRGTPAPRPPAADPAPRVNVLLWFDTEDYILPASDDAALRLAEFLSREGIRATFKVVGEKARVLERRGRRDVIEALSRHEIGYHTDFHSAQPTPAMYLAALGWDEGVAEFERRERRGFDDVARLFGQRPGCYGQPGGSWAPQTFGALRKWNVPVYLDDGGHVGLENRPFYYGGLLTLYRLAQTVRTGLGGPQDLEAGKKRFDEARRKLLAEGGGLVSVYYHPCEWVHREFWDGVNFSRGANPPREKWQVPPQKTPEETRAAFETFEAWVRHMKTYPDVRFITARDTLRIWKDKARGRAFPKAEIREIAQAATGDAGFQRRGDYALSAGEVFALLLDFVNGRAPDSVTLGDIPGGPADPVVELASPATTDWSQFSRTAADTAGYLRHHGRIPAAVWLGGTAVPPEAFLGALARAALELLEGRTPETVEVRPASLAAAAHVAADGPRLWGWVVFPPGFRAPAMMELAKRQAWTLKPAILDRAE